MKIIKRNGSEVVFDIEKIINAVTKANNAVEEAVRMTPLQIDRIAEAVVIACQKYDRALGVEEIQDMVEHHIMAHGAF
jgi:ribonucleoside-triphosphate reductase